MLPVQRPSKPCKGGRAACWLADCPLQTLLPGAWHSMDVPLMCLPVPALLQHDTILQVFLLPCMQTGKLHAGAGELEAAEAAFAKASANTTLLQKQLAPDAPEAPREEAATALFKLCLARTDISWRLQQSVRARIECFLCGPCCTFFHNLKHSYETCRHLQAPSSRVPQSWLGLQHCQRGSGSACQWS